MSDSAPAPVAFRPRLSTGSEASNIFTVFAVQLAAADPVDADRVRDAWLCRVSSATNDGQILRVCISVLADLRAQSWILELSEDGVVSVAQPRNSATTPAGQKDRVRKGHLRERNHQLAQPSVRQFIEDMERPRLHKSGWLTIFALMRDGRELATALQKAAALAGDDRIAALRDTVSPYLQPVLPGVACEHTGLLLSDIWRYFRHTWTNHYSSTPGRQVGFLIRDGAAQNHPVIGIGAYGSAVVQLAVRDEWIGWSPEAFFRRLKAEPDQLGKWLLTTLDQLIGSVYIDDFVSERLLNRVRLRAPDSALIQRLLAAHEQAGDEHRKDPSASEHKASTQRGNNWKAEARSPLFRSKRAKVLAQLLAARLVLNDRGFTPSTPLNALALLTDARSKKAIQIILRHAKAAHVGVDMVDITVCGAIAPYGPILGGKLVALLLASPTAAAEYERRYRDAVSVIASSMAGRPVVRRPKLVLLGTTSLYGLSSSQYNRLKVPIVELGGAVDGVLEFKELGHSTGFGSFHFSKSTTSEIDVLLAQRQQGRPVNSIFGEGVNPKLRKIRSGLEEVGLPAEVLLRHGDGRLVYGVALASNFREVLLGLTSRRKSLVPQGKTQKGTSALVDFWIRRWLSKRIDRPDVIDSVRSHSLVHPIHHGARVALPEGPSNLPRQEGLQESE